MKTTRSQGGYTVTGTTSAGELVQYEVSKNGSGWAVGLLYGKGATLNTLYPTKAEAVQAIKNQ